MIYVNRREMDSYLERCSKSLSTFLEDELPLFQTGLYESCREHLVYFRSFLQAHYVEKFGHYPPTGPESRIFPKDAYELMTTEFQNLYQFLVDENSSPNDGSPPQAQGRLRVLQSVQAFDQRHFYDPLPHPLPLLPQVFIESPPPSRRRFIWDGKLDVDDRVANFKALAKATHRRKAELLDCDLVRSYREFEQECMFLNKDNKLSLSDARKVRWILIYAMLQTLLFATKIANEVCNIGNVHYDVCVRCCPPWQDETSNYLAHKEDVIATH
jgi:hypothetical protein